MKVNIYLKHLIIPVIVVTIVLSSLFIAPFIALSNSKISVSFLYSSNSVAVESIEQVIWNGLKSAQEGYDDTLVSNMDQNTAENISLLSIDYARSTSKGDASAKLSIYTSTSDIIIIYGNTYNDSLQSVVASNPTKNFILINNDSEIKSNNTSYLKVDQTVMYSEVLSDIKKNTSTKSAIYVSSLKEDENENFKAYVENDDINFAYIYVPNSEDFSDIATKVNSKLEEGYDQVFIDDIVYVEYVTNLVTNFQQKIIEQNLSNKNEIDTLEKQLEKATLESEIELLNTQIEDLKKAQEEKKYKQSKIDIYNYGYDYTKKTTYIDEEDNQKSVVKSSYVFDSSNIFKQIFDIIISGEVLEKELTYKYEDFINKVVGGNDEEN